MYVTDNFLQLFANFLQFAENINQFYKYSLTKKIPGSNFLSCLLSLAD